MSLINDALKKAQKQRTGEAPPLSRMPSIGGESAVRIAKRDKPAGFNALLLRLGLGAGAVLVLVVGGYFALRGKSENRGQKSEVSPAVTSSQASVPVPNSQPSTLNSQPAPATPAPAFSLPIASKPEPVVAPKPDVRGQKSEVRPAVTNSQPSTLNSQPAAPAAPSTVAPTTDNRQPSTSPPPAAAAPAAKLDGKAITYIENLKIAGIRASSSDAKVLMNDRVYRLGSMVEAELGLKLVGITANSLTFENEAGARYTRTF